MTGSRRYHEPQTCPDCGKTVATLVPWHGDGSLARFVAHGPVKNRCPGTRRVPPGYTLWQDSCSLRVPIPPSTYEPEGDVVTTAQVIQKGARISECGLYRYWLTRRWDDRPTADTLVFVMLNPSTADADLDDPTIRRCIGFARRDGYGAMSVLNLYAWRATDPKALLTCADPVGPLNDQYIGNVLETRTLNDLPVVAAWGANARPDRVRRVRNLIPGVDWRCLGTTKDGHPRHPLYVKGDQPLVPFTGGAS